MNSKSYLIPLFIIVLSSFSSAVAGAARLYATISPTSAQVYILNITPEFRQGMTLKPGTYQILVAKRGYKGVRKNIRVSQHDIYLNAKLVKDNASQASTLSVTSRYTLRVNTQPKDARIRIMNINPRFKQGIQLLPGKYDILVTREGYASKRRWINITDRNVTLNWRLKKRSQASQNRTTTPSSTVTKSALAQQAQPLLLNEAMQESCFSHTTTHQLENHSTTAVYQARLQQYPEFVNVDFVSDTQGLRNAFKFSGVRMGDKLELVGAVSYDGIRETVKASMVLEGSQLLVNIQQEGELLLKHVLGKVACSQVDI